MYFVFLIFFIVFNSSISTAGSNSPAVACIHDNKNFRCVEFVKNYDGDTITVNIPNIHPLIGQNAAVRLNGVDAPELRSKNSCEKKMAKKVRDFVYKKLKNAKRIDLVNIERDKYFRILADVVIDGQSLSSMLLQKGYAYEYHGETKQDVDWCVRLKKKNDNK